MPYQSINPRTGQLIARYADTAEVHLQSSLENAHIAQKAWGKRSLPDRIACIERLALAFRQNKERLAALASKEMGKNRHEAEAEILKCAALCEYLANNASMALEARPVNIPQAFARVRYEPLGVILGIMPWNFPYWQVARFALPALLSGNTCLLKHAPNVQGCAEAFCSLLHDVLPTNELLTNLRLSNERTELLIADDRVAAVSLTGSTRAGKAVAAAAGAALKPCVLELGGSDPYVVLADADLTLAARTCVEARLLNAGQSCISAKRLIVEDAVAERFAERLTEEVQQYTSVREHSADDEPKKLAPMAREDLRSTLHQQVVKSVAAGAKLLRGGEVPPGPGSFYPVTVLDKVAPGMPAFDEELFGPVISLITARDEQHAIELANQTSYGLGAAVFTRDVVRGEQIAAHELQAGSCFVNAAVRSDARLPFGGIKASGFGRELSIEGLRAFCNVKTLYVSHSG